MKNEIADRAHYIYTIQTAGASGGFFSGIRGMENAMKYRYSFLFPLLFLSLFCSCEKVSPDAVEIGLEYSWKGPGENLHNPEIKLTGAPGDTKLLEIQLVDLDLTFANHGEVERIPYDGSGVISFGSLKNYIGPAPPRLEGYKGHLYEFTVKAMDENDVVIGIGKKAKLCCPHKL